MVVTIEPSERLVAHWSANEKEKVGYPVWSYEKLKYPRRTGENASYLPPWEVEERHQSYGARGTRIRLERLLFARTKHPTVQLHRLDSKFGHPVPAVFCEPQVDVIARSVTSEGLELEFRSRSGMTWPFTIPLEWIISTWVEEKKAGNFQPQIFLAADIKRGAGGMLVGVPMPWHR